LAFNQRLILPITLENLELGDQFDNEIILPPELRYLTIGKYFSKSVKLPSKLHMLKWYCDMDIPSLPNIICLCVQFNLNIKELPVSLKQLYWYCTNKLCTLPNRLEDQVILQTYTIDG
jgi:hypothetical protein